MKNNKKNNLVERQRYQTLLKRNRKISQVNIFIIGSALVAHYAGYENIASPLLWLGIILLIYTIGSNLLIRHKIKKMR